MSQEVAYNIVAMPQKGNSSTSENRKSLAFMSIFTSGAEHVDVWYTVSELARCATEPIISLSGLKAKFPR